MPKVFMKLKQYTIAQAILHATLEPHIYQPKQPDFTKVRTQAKVQYRSNRARKKKKGQRKMQNPQANEAVPQ